ncbi:hypothetical protein PC129_g24678 [Phytophthora cactorum]|uniref:Uncharacterized protein n=1 Tax=Phytophthora cactorum TaxID=29920 RepID=A0A8T1GRI9_9STRA|nr:hypothetical protein PC112_g24935 [Phytophthora cactorum]KAG2799503.1 hypothetical protein PC113_g24803 [Phytophthora cactorum]KAG2867534.1 hypothetical protein PC114_g27869 [Phytophthora cactorum]KAG2870863.1 hypothetical protein PC115_g25000 [Phytophthora cactorum]KAG2877712.1 hypothetical protein PC117_g27041 [Phytophthora cactorum]
MSHSSWKDCWNFDSLEPDFTAWQIGIRTPLENEGGWEIETRIVGTTITGVTDVARRLSPKTQKAFQLLINSLDDATVNTMSKYK